MRYLHTMVRVTDVDASLDFYCNKLGLEEVRRTENEKCRFILIFLAAPKDGASSAANRAPELELTYNWDPETYTGGRNFGRIYRHHDPSKLRFASHRPRPASDSNQAEAMHTEVIDGWIHFGGSSYHRHKIAGRDALKSLLPGA